MADNDIIEEICVDHGKRSLVASVFQRIMLLFSVEVQFSSPEESAVKSGFQWLALKGEKDNVVKAKEYVKSRCNPELELEVPFSERFYEVLLKSLDELEKTTSAVVKFTSRKSCHLQGSAESVTMAQSAIEDKMRTPPTSHTSSVPAIEPQLREFARKLGYSNQVIDQAVQKLGPDVTQNTLLNELLKTTASLPYQISASAQPKPTPAMAPYPVRRDVVARGAPNTSGHVLRPGYENPRATVAGAQHTWERDLIAKMPRPNPELYPDAIPRGTKRVLERPSDIIARGAGPSVPPLMQVQPYNSPGPSPYENHKEASSSASDRLDEQEQLMYQQILGAKKVSANSSSNLRPVVIDGSNVAMSHGRQDIFSCKGIQLCVEWFRAKGHKEITVFVPLWRKEASRPDKPITDQEILYSLERDGILVFTPSRKVNGRRIVCYDDRFIIKLAAETDGVVVSNDNFRDLTNENPKWRETIEQRLLMYSFVGDKFMVPDDPLGKHGPNLEDFLRKGSPTHPRICPYLKKCTYGLKCRFYHPERDQEALNLKLERLIGIFGESVPEASMRKAINDNPSANVTILANILCDMGNKY